MRSNLRKTFVLLLLFACLLMSACTGNTMPTETEPVTIAKEALATTAQDEKTEPTTEPVTEPATEPTTVPSESVPVVYSIIMEDLAGDVGMWVEVCEGGEVTGRFYQCAFPIQYDFENITPVDALDVSGISSWIRYYREDGTADVILYAGDIIQCTVNGNTEWFLAEARPKYDWLMENLRGTIQSLRLPIRLGYSGSAETALENYALQSVYDAQVYGGSEDDFEMLNISIRQQSGNVISADLEFAVRGGRGLAGASNYAPGTGEYEGWTIYQDSVVLEKHGDGLWYEISQWDYMEWQNGGIGSNQKFADMYIRNAEELLDTLEDQIAVLGISEADLAKLADLFLRCTTAVSITEREDFDWSVLTTWDASNHIGFRTMLMIKGGYFRGRMDRNFEPAFVRIDNDRAVVRDNDTILYFHLTDGRWQVDDVMRPSSR